MDVQQVAVPLILSFFKFKAMMGEQTVKASLKTSNNFDQANMMQIGRVDTANKITIYSMLYIIQFHKLTI